MINTRNRRLLLEKKLVLNLVLALALFGLFAACGEKSEHGHEDQHSHDDEHGHEDEHGESWSVTAWGERYELFPEIDGLVAGEVAEAHTHVTILDGFAPLTDGTVSIVLTGSGGDEQTFSTTEPIRPGIYQIEVAPRASGEFDLAFRVETAAGDETIPGGRVRVGTADKPGGLVSAPSLLSGPAGTTGTEPVSFLKEPQWQDTFATAWVREGTFARSLEGLAEARPAAGGEAWITAPVEALVEARPWPYVGQAFDAGETIFRLAPSVSPARSLAGLEADVDAARQELDAAESRLARLEQLLEVEATSDREVEDARTRVGVAKARHDAARSDLDAARAAREGRGGGSALQVKAPFAGRVAAVEATPGAAAAASEKLARLVRTDVVWLSVALPPDAASKLSKGFAGVMLGDSHLISGDEARLVSVAPGVDPATGKLQVLVEIPGETPGGRVPLGSTWDAQILLDSDVPGIVIPTSALVDDGGETVVFLQLGGESFVRQSVDVVARQGDRALVNGLVPGQRLVTLGADSIRRSSLMASGAGHGHMH